MACRAVLPAAQMRRIGYDVDSGWYTGAGNGRGAWWCAADAHEEMPSATRLARAFRRPVNPNDVEDISRLLGSK